MIPVEERGGFIVETDPLPLTYTAVEIKLSPDILLF